MLVSFKPYTPNTARPAFGKDGKGEDFNVFDRTDTTRKYDVDCLGIPREAYEKLEAKRAAEKAVKKSGGFFSKISRIFK